MKKLQAPSFSEGFDEIYNVENLDEQGFKIKEITREV